MPRDGSIVLSDVRERMLAIVCEPCGRRGRPVVARLIERPGVRRTGKHAASQIPLDQTVIVVTANGPAPCYATLGKGVVGIASPGGVAGKGATCAGAFGVGQYFCSLPC
jgi:hypothetical protein